MPIIVPVMPVGSSANIPPRTVSAVTAVSASKGVGSGLISLRLAFTDVLS